ncbi:MAG: hypothetical protein IPK74_01430 [Deltaproteobacteria bacterium]|nr:hypothetical protein [Deltaproteobacteria bacterium]
MRALGVPLAGFIGASACVHVRPDAPEVEVEGATSDGSTSAVSSASSSDDDAGVRLDLGTTDVGYEGEGCAAIDFVFVIDNSNSMELYQERLAAAVPGFLAALAAFAPTGDARVMVVDTDAERLRSYPCVDDACCAYVCEHGNPAGPCDGHACPEDPPPFACDDVMGAGLVNDADGVACGVAPGTRWLEADAPDFAEAFTCLAMIGANSYWQWPAAAMTQAISPALTEPGGCNEGFLRDEALLVVVWLGDEDEPIPGEHPWPSAGDPSAWYQALLDAKGGDPRGVSLLAIGPDPSPMIGDVVTSLGANALRGSIHGDYAKAFANAIATVDGACARFVPPG